MTDTDPNLFNAVGREDLLQIMGLLSHGSGVNAKDRNGYTPSTGRANKSASGLSACFSSIKPMR